MEERTKTVLTIVGIFLVEAVQLGFRASTTSVEVIGAQIGFIASSTFGVQAVAFLLVAAGQQDPLKALTTP